MRTVWKATIPSGVNVDHEVWMPGILHIVKARFDEESRQIDIWFLCNPDAELVAKKFRVIGTGSDYDHPDGDVVQYIDTVFEGHYVWHIFETLGKKCPGPQ